MLSVLKGLHVPPSAICKGQVPLVANLRFVRAFLNESANKKTQIG